EISAGSPAAPSSQAHKAITNQTRRIAPTPFSAHRRRALYYQP
ncbi:MAG: hypothetical protein ACI9U2_002894, partial [Bradymonadia bacterium]